MAKRDHDHTPTGRAQDVPTPVTPHRTAMEAFALEVQTLWQSDQPEVVRTFFAFCRITGADRHPQHRH